MRGLKLVLVLKSVKKLRRIFYRCVDWNHHSRGTHNRACKSHLLQMRGLKLSQCRRGTGANQSHLLQMRGLKHFCLDREHHRHEVASFTDAWIETTTGALKDKKNWVASFTDAWIETSPESTEKKLEAVASFTDAWIETLKLSNDYMSFCRIFYRCVDWNRKGQTDYNTHTSVASFTDAWIETKSTL